MAEYEGGCHCGAVRWRVEIDWTKSPVSGFPAVECNCSMCRRKGFLHLIVPPERFTLLQGADKLSTYTFNTGTAQHLFCQNCGIHSFYRPRSHPQDFDVNIRCFDEDLSDRFDWRQFDGQNWEQNINLIR